jgi:glutamyl-tRNA synthetase
MVIGRAAPSNTGRLHPGNCRSILFSYLAAKKNNGKFHIRIEDTDIERCKEEYTKDILKAIEQMGLKYDGEIVIQSQEINYHKSVVNQLLKQKNAFYCFCSAEEAVNDKNDGSKGYSGTCLSLTDKQIKENLENKIPYVIRLKTPSEGVITFNDLNFGTLSFNWRDISACPVLIKSNGGASYTLANVCDDNKLGVNLITRGSEWISSTPLHIYLRECLGWEIPQYCHLPVINGNDGKKLSKRHGAVLFDDLIKEGYLPEAIINYIVFLGWNPRNSQEFFTLEELEKNFDINNINTAPAVFDYVKLKWFNKHYITQMNMEQYLSKMKEFNPSITTYVAQLLKTRISTFQEGVEQTKFINNLSEYDIDLFKNTKAKCDYEVAYRIFDDYINNFHYYNDANSNDSEWLLNELESIGKRHGIHKTAVMWAIRIALSGQTVTPGGATDLLLILGKDESYRRIKLAYNKLDKCVPLDNKLSA